MTKKTKKSKQRKQKQKLASFIPFLIVVTAITGFVSFLWISSEIDETLNELEIQQAIVVDLNDNIGNLKDDIEYYSRVDILTARAEKELGMVYTVPETIAIYVDKNDLIEN